MNQFLLFAQEHPTLIVGAITAAGTWLFNNVFTAAIAALPAPTKDSTQKYIFWFKFLNSLVGNYLRAHHAIVELSPNWQDAVEKLTRIPFASVQTGVVAKDTLPNA